MNPAYALKKVNNWWKTGAVDGTFLHKRIRSEFSSIIESLQNNLITRLVGPSGTGKTSLLYSTVNYLLNSGVAKERVLFFSGNDMALFGEHRSLGSLLETYSNDVVHENLFEFKSPVYILIDDIEFIDDWQVYLFNYRKKIPNVKFISAQVFDTSDEDISEDVFDITVMPLTLTQFTDFYCANRDSSMDLVRFKSFLPDCTVFNNLESFYRIISENIYPLSEYRPYKAKVMDEYLLCGGYPGFFASAGLNEWQNTLNTAVDMALYRDVAALSGLKSPQKLKRLLYIIADHGGREQSFGSIGRSIYVDTSTIIGYINAVSRCGYAGVAENYCQQSLVEGRVVRKNKRLYILDQGIFNAVLGISDITQDYENAVRRCCLYTAKIYANRSGGNVYFWKDGKRSVDFVYTKGKLVLPILISYPREATEQRVKSLKAFMRCYGVLKGIVITKDVLKSDGNIYYIPAWLL